MRRRGGSAAACRAVLALTLALAALAGCDRSTPPGETGGAAQLLPVPLPDLSRLRADLRDRLAAAHRALDGGGATAGAYGETGKLLLAAEYPDAAEPCFRNAATLAPEEFVWPYYLGHLYRGSGDFERAAASFERALALRPEEPAVLIWLGRTQLERGELDAAEPLLARALELHPGSASALYGLGKLALERGEHAEAVRRLEEALVLTPDATIAHYPLALAYRGLGDAARAEEHLARRGEVEVFPYDPWMEEVRSMLAGPAVQTDRGARMYIDGRWQDAAEEFRRAVEADPEDARLRVNLGSTLLRLGDLDGAAREYDRAAALDPGLAGAFYGQGAVAERRGDDDAADRHYRAALEADPRHLPTHLRLGHLARRRGRPAEALPHYRALIEVDPRDAEARMGRAMALARLGRHADARAELEQAVRALPDQPAFAHALARLLVASPDGAVRDPARGMELLQELSRTLQNTDVAESIAMGLAELGRFEEAVTWQSNAIASAERAGRSDVAARMRDNLERYRRGEPCRDPWPAGHPVHAPDRDAAPAPLERDRGAA